MQVKIIITQNINNFKAGAKLKINISLIKTQPKLKIIKITETLV